MIATLPFMHTPSGPHFIPSQEDMVQKIARETLHELALSLAIGAVVASFVATPIGQLTLLTSLIAQTTLNLFLRILGTIAKIKANAPTPYKEVYQLSHESLSRIPFATFGVFTADNGMILLHETGHALAVKAFGGTLEKIEVRPFLGGSTFFLLEKANWLRRKLGDTHTLACITMAGPSFAVALSSIGLAASFLTEKTHPHFSEYLYSASLYNFWNHGVYALSALHTPSSRLTHDFVRLAIYGIHPIAATVAILAIPILISAYYFTQSER